MLFAKLSLTTKSMKLSDVARNASVGEDPADKAYKALEEARAASRPMQSSGEPVAARPGRGKVRVPDLEGLPVRAALQRVFELGLTPVIEGSGRLSRVEPAAGTALPKGSKLTLVFEPQT